KLTCPPFAVMLATKKAGSTVVVVLFESGQNRDAIVPAPPAPFVLATATVTPFFSPSFPKDVAIAFNTVAPGLRCSVNALAACLIIATDASIALHCHSEPSHVYLPVGSVNRTGLLRTYT